MIAGSGTHGIIENDMFYENQRSGTYQIPSDWTMTLNYNSGMFGGSVQLKTRLEFYEEKDIKSIEKFWQPTQTHFIDFEQ